MNKEEINYVLESLRFKTSIYRDKKKRNLPFNDDEYYSNILIEYIEELHNKIDKIRELVENSDWRLDDVHDLIDGYNEIEEILKDSDVDSANKKTRSLWGSRSEAQRIYYQRQTIKRLEKENEKLKEKCEKQQYAITENCDLRLEIEQLKEQRQELRNWLEEWLKIIEKQYDELKEPVRKSYLKVTIDTLNEVLSKLNELEGKND